MRLDDLDSRIIASSGPLLSVGPSPAAGPTRTGTTPGSAAAPGSAGSSGPTFSHLLADQLSTNAARAKLKFSGHAQQRLASRQISLTQDDLQRIGDAVTRAAAKGSRESLVLTDKAALVVSVPNRTVITAVAPSQMKENIFTNIDSAVIV
jgi:flagellar operon protein